MFALLLSTTWYFGFKALLVGVVAPPTPVPSQPPVKASLNQKAEESLRAIIYSEEVFTRLRDNTALPEREIELKSEIIELHKTHRAETIRILLEIVKGGRPVDARTAAITAIALEEGPVAPVTILYWDLKQFDKSSGKDQPTDREILVARVTKSFQKANGK